MEDLDARGKMIQFLVLTEGRTATSVQCALSFCKYPQPLAGSQVSLLRMHLVATVLPLFLLGLYERKGSGMFCKSRHFLLFCKISCELFNPVV